MKTNKIAEEIVKEHGLLVGSRAWCPVIAELNNSDYDYVITMDLYNIIKPFVVENKSEIGDNAEEYELVTSDLQTVGMFYFDCKYSKVMDRTYNILLIDKEDLYAYEKMSKIINRKVNESPEFKKLLENREVRKLLMQSTLVAARR